MYNGLKAAKGMGNLCQAYQRGAQQWTMTWFFISRYLISRTIEKLILFHFIRNISHLFNSCWWRVKTAYHSYTLYLHSCTEWKQLREKQGKTEEELLEGVLLQPQKNKWSEEHLLKPEKMPWQHRDVGSDRWGLFRKSQAPMFYF